MAQKQCAELRDKILSAIAVGDIMNNPGRGPSEILAITDTAIWYRRGSSPIHLKIMHILRAYKHFSGSRVSSRELNDLMPQVFGKTGGHTCNVTFLLLVLGRAGLASPISGRGVAGDPFAADFTQTD